MTRKCRSIEGGDNDLCLKVFYYVSVIVEVKVLTMRLVAAVVVGFDEDYGLVEQNGRSGLGI